MAKYHDEYGTCYTVKTPGGEKEGTRGNPHNVHCPEPEIVHRGRPSQSDRGGREHSVRGHKGGVKHGDA